MLFIWVWEQIHFPKCVLTGKQDAREVQRLGTLRTFQNWIACWRLRITNIDSIQYWKNISWEYLSLFVCLFELCSASINALQTVFSNSSYDNTGVFLARQSPVEQGLLIHEVSRSHTTTHTVGGTPLDEWLARRRDLWQHSTPITGRNPCPGGIRTQNLRRRKAADLRSKPRGHWDRWETC